MSPKRKSSVLSGWSEDMALSGWAVATTLLNPPGSSSETASVILKERAALQSNISVWKRTKAASYRIFSLVCHLHSGLKHKLYAWGFACLLALLCSCLTQICQKDMKKKIKTKTKPKSKSSSANILALFSPGWHKTRFIKHFHRK